MVQPLEGTRKRLALRRTEGRKQTAVFSPDGNWIVYTSDKSGRREIYVRVFPDGEIEHKVSQEGGVAPRWRADGKEIFFLSPDATMMAARVDTVQGFNVAAPERLFPTGLDSPATGGLGMVNRIIIAGAVIAAMLLWLGPFSVPNWAVIGFVLVVLFPLAVVLSVKRIRLESRLARTLWLALTRK